MGAMKMLASGLDGLAGSRPGARGAGRWAFEGPTTHMAGLFPFTAGHGAPSSGVPVGHHLLSREIVACDPFAWHRAGLVTNLGMMVLGSPGAGKTALAKRVLRGLIAQGVTVVVLGDPKGEYTAVVRSAGGQVIRVGRGRDRINPLDAGLYAAALRSASASRRVELEAEIRGQRLNALLALVTLARRERPADWEAAVLGASLDSLTDLAEPTVGDVLSVLADGPARLVEASQVPASRFSDETIALRRTLRGLVDGVLRGVFDGPTTTPLNLGASAVAVDLSAVTGAGDELLAAAMLTSWSYGHAMIEGSLALVDGRRFLVVLDEMWRALRGSSALIEQADALTRVYRHKSVAHLLLTHSLDDLAAVETQADRAKTAGFLDRCAITALTAMSERELEAVSAVRRLSSAEVATVTAWSSASSWRGGAVHPGRGRYLLKAGDRPGVPVRMQLVGDEAALYDTDPGALA